MRTVMLLALLLLAGAQSALAGERSPEVNYVLRCAGCHGMDGTGAEKAGIPPFPGLVDAFFADPQGRLYLMHVPGVVSNGLNDREIAQVMNYVGDRWRKPGAEIRHFSEAEVARLRTEPVADLVGLRRDIARRLKAEGIPVAGYPWP